MLFIFIISVGVIDDTPRVNQICDWDPMQADYLSGKNKYSIDDEDVGSALHGYGTCNLHTRMLLFTHSLFHSGVFHSHCLVIFPCHMCVHVSVLVLNTDKDSCGLAACPILNNTELWSSCMSHFK